MGGAQQLESTITSLRSSIAKAHAGDKQNTQVSGWLTPNDVFKCADGFFALRLMPLAVVSAWRP